MLDITDRLKAGDNVVVVRVYDPATDMTIPRGKQYWKPKSETIFYTRTTGLWQPVWIEAAGATRIGRLRITPDVDKSQARIEADLVPAVQQTPGTGEAPALRLRADGNARRRGAGSAGGQRARHAGSGRHHARTSSACGGPIVPRFMT